MLRGRLVGIAAGQIDNINSLAAIQGDLGFQRIEIIAGKLCDYSGRLKVHVHCTSLQVLWNRQ
ncbi:hypothetical protein D3C73_1555020 [compost metagenome]